MLNENMIQYRYSLQVIQDTILWLQAKKPKDSPQHLYFNEYMLVYISAQIFNRDFPSLALFKRMQQVKEYANRAKAANESQAFKVLVLFNSVSDSLSSGISLV